jgi:hypothetical protein
MMVILVLELEVALFEMKSSSLCASVVETDIKFP